MMDFGGLTIKIRGISNDAKHLKFAESIRKKGGESQTKRMTNSSLWSVYTKKCYYKTKVVNKTIKRKSV